MPVAYAEMEGTWHVHLALYPAAVSACCARPAASPRQPALQGGEGLHPGVLGLGQLSKEASGHAAIGALPRHDLPLQAELRAVVVERGSDESRHRVWQGGGAN